MVFGEELGLDGGGDFALAVERSAGGEADEEEGDADHAEEDEQERRQTSDDELEHAWRVGQGVEGGKKNRTEVGVEKFDSGTL